MGIIHVGEQDSEHMYILDCSNAQVSVSAFTARSILLVLYERGIIISFNAFP